MVKLTLENISYGYDGKQILNDISFEVLPSELVCLVGPSGSGKSTLLRLILGLDTMQLGDIKINDESIIKTPTRNRNIGVVFQDPSLFPHLNVGDNICFGLRKLDKKKRVEICQNMLALIEMQDYEKKHPNQLSGGQQQRVALARALAPSPNIMLLDEPFANLDNNLRNEIRDEVISILKSLNVPTIMVTHSPDEALIVADKIIMLNKTGQIHQQGDPDIIHNQPIDIESAEFFGPISKIPAIIENELIISEFGSLCKKTYAPNIANGAQVLIVTRPEGLKKVSKDDAQSTQVTINSVRHTGAGWLVKAKTQQNNDIIYHHIYGNTPKKNSITHITFQKPHIFVFEV